MSKKLLLVLPRNERGFWGKVRNGKAGMVRLSLPTIAALTPPEWEVQIHDSRVSPVNYEQPVDLVGITSFTAEITSAYEIADTFRSRGVTVVMGGVHVTALPEEALLHADAVVAGEAEGVWLRLIRDFEDGNLKKLYQADDYCDMRQMTPPRRDLLNRQMYVTGFYTLQATRGCPFDCDYCAVTGVFGKTFRMRPVDEVIAEIRGFDSSNFFFVDDNICGNPAYAKRLFRELIPLKKKWGGQSSITFSRDEELLKLYYQAGGRYAFVGIETISEEALASMNKSWNKAGEYFEQIKRIQGAGIAVLGSFIFGLDDDDSTVFERTLEFIDRSGIDAAQFHILTPFPGTRQYESMDADGRIIERDWAKYHTGEVVFSPKQLSPEELVDGYCRIWKQTYSPWRVIKRIFRRPYGIFWRTSLNLGYRNKARRVHKL